MRARGQSALTPSSVAKELQQLQYRLGEPVASIREQLASWERGRYIAAGIPFVVPGQQLFLPMLFLDLRDVKRRLVTEVKRWDYLTWAARAVALRHLLSEDVENASLQNLAERFGYPGILKGDHSLFISTLRSNGLHGQPDHGILEPIRSFLFQNTRFLTEYRTLFSQKKSRLLTDY